MYIMNYWTVLSTCGSEEFLTKEEAKRTSEYLFSDEDIIRVSYGPDLGNGKYQEEEVFGDDDIVGVDLVPAPATEHTTTEGRPQ